MDPLLSDREALMARLRPVLEARPEVVFALLFGSVARGQATPLSDVDVGIYTEQPLDLPELGGLVNELEQVAGRPVDVVELREALEQWPALAYEAVAHGKLIFCRDEDRWVDFKCRTFLAYFDTEPLRRMMRDAFLERLKKGQLAERRYAGIPPSS
ncbi:type VII toxin-antitoxin system MntA family adenylyltransferase antitoxin [Rhodothermus marinus]|uniref:DNA polymerase beta domain protein region n=1 Tax=Rhodothermus marinus (strain ATCC 43812 / DSM 4252 / R-10) TaxID=518766 RepID=D0MKG8_RHOM4|nr:nucleotidyltransferase domain-containing protein [Rhodothermus marinus]ACY48880.1 DNA polymerase beta domain protein region [Rhodothermus marinus DSM 4252]